MDEEKRSAEIQNVISKLRFLSKVKKGEKLQIDKLSVVENTWYAKLMRVWNTLDLNQDSNNNIENVKESRRKSLKFIKDLYEEGLRLASSIVKETSSYYTDLWSMLVKSLKDAQPGISNLMISYESDRLYISEVETFIDVLNAKIHNLEDERKFILLKESCSDVLENKDEEGVF